MNALIVIFFLSMLINDVIFKEGALVRIYIYLFIGYMSIYIITSKSKAHSIYKNTLLAIYSQSYDPTIYGSMRFSIGKLKVYLDNYNKTNNTKVSWTLLITKILGLAIAKHPIVNVAIRFGKLVQKETIDLSVLINLEGKVSIFVNLLKNLAKKLLTEVDKKSLKELNDDLYQSVDTTRKGKDKEFNKQVSLLGALPS